MTPEEIRAEIEKCYEQSKHTHMRLLELRNECKHEKTHDGLYSHGAGRLSNEVMCDYCDEVIRPPCVPEKWEHVTDEERRNMKTIKFH